MKNNILKFFSDTVLNAPSKVAVIDGDDKITFEELDLRAKILATSIIKSNMINEPVAVFLPKSIETIITDIAITYSGNIYMNLDVKTPSIRIGKILDRIKPKLIVTNSNFAVLIHAIDITLPLIIIDEFDFKQSYTTDLISDKLDQIIDTDPLCIINTSGSTGTPKGVVLNHRSYIDYTNWAINTFGFNGTEKLGVLSPTIFDHFNFEICLMMFKGNTLVLLDNNMASFPIKLLEHISAEKVNFIFWVPSIMVNIANMDLLTKIKLPSLKMVWFAGEVFPTKQFNYWKNNLPQSKFVNLYGPIETTVDCTYYVVERNLKDDEPIPIGYPCRNTDVLVLNKENKLVGTNEDGELCVRGSSLAMGYYNNVEKTSASFTQNPLNTSYPEIIYRTGDIVFKNEFGELVFKGRIDSLIKHMGYRIELGEIEHVIINTLKLVKNGCIVYNYSKKAITLFYESENDIIEAEMKKKIGKVFPRYMVPSAFYQMKNLPRNTNGKIDRLKLRNQINND